MDCVHARLGTDRDHPRACGEHYASWTPNTRFKGSSPRLRGTSGKGITMDAVTGIIPALAGNICVPRRGRPFPRDHPRACGEHLWDEGAIVKTVGSSPRLRGTSRPHTPLPFDCGIIPALAGNMRCACGPLSHCGDHPRACGEHSRLQRRCVKRTGSSPRLRGTSFRLAWLLSHVGIIPALAGNIVSHCL